MPWSLLDEVLERAWSRLAVHAPEQPLGVWPEGILKETMDELLSRPGESAPVDPKRLDVVEGVLPLGADHPLSLEARLNPEQPELAAAEHLAPARQGESTERGRTGPRDSGASKR